MASIGWVAWGTEAFARARSESRPVLLAIAPSWCDCSQQMDRTAYTDPDVCAIVTASFVPIRVDPDRRPDVSERYSLGGWPTTAFLTPDGHILGGGTYVEADKLRDALERVAEAFSTRRHLRRPSLKDTVRPSPSGPQSVERLIAQVFDCFDAVHAGFGGRPKFPHTAPIRLAMALYKETGSERVHDIAVRSLDAMGWGPLYDEEEGGFFSYSHEADWSDPHHAKRLDVNASLLSIYIEALETLGLARYADRAAGVLRYTQNWLADQMEGGWAGSQQADGEYYGQRSKGRVGRTGVPSVDRTLFCDWNASMVSAALHAGRVLGDASIAEFAIKSLERVLLLCYKPGLGVGHYADTGGPQVRGLLEDQIAMAAASLDAFEATGNVVYRMMAQELAGYATRTLWDEASDGLSDRAIDPRRDIGLLKEPLTPFVSNCVAARLLRRVAEAPESAEFVGYADRILKTMDGRAAAEGVLAAEYVLAVGLPSGR